MALDPDGLTCPECDADDITLASTNLSTLGYLATDHTFQCGACGHHFACGEPVGEFGHDIVDDTGCGVCGATGYLYQLHEGVSGVALRFKCPDCYYVWVVEREWRDGAITVGYAELMGERDGARPYGYEE